MSLLSSAFAAELLANIILPWLIYVQTQPEIGRVHALMTSSLPPIAWSVIQLIRKRRVDALSMLVLGGIALSLLAFLGGGSFRMLELREHLVAAIVGLVFVGSVAVKRPLLEVVLRSMAAGKPQAEVERLQNRLNDRRWLMLMTLAIGALLLIQTSAAVILVFTLPVREFLVVSPLLNYLLIALFLGTALYARHRARTAAVGIRSRNSD